MKINGSLLFDASSASEIQNLRIQKFANFAAVPAYQSADAGRMVFAQDTGIIYYGSSATGTWVAIATGGNATALQAELDATQVSIGASVNADGTFNQAAFTNVAGALVSPTSITNAINQLASNLNANNELSELDDVTLSSLANGQFLRYDSGSSRWVNHTLVLANVTDVTVPVGELNLLTGLTATAAEINILGGVTGTSAADISSIAGFAAEGVSATEFGHLAGVTSSIQDQLDNKQALDTDLTNIAGLTGTGIAVRTSAGGAWATRTLVAPAAGITISDPAGVAGDPTFALANDLAAIEGLTSTGYIVRTGDGTATTRTINGVAGRTVVTNGDGVASNTDFDLATVTDGGTGTFLKFTRDAYGRVSGTTAVVEGDITTLVDGVYVNAAGDSMSGNLVMGTNYVTMNNAPTDDTHATNKAYVDSVANGLTWKNAVKAASTGNLTLSGEQTVDGIALVAGDRVLVKDQTTTSENGIYVVSASGWTRSTNADTPAELNGAAVFVQSGTVNDNSGWTQTADVVTVGTSPVIWAQFSGSNTYTWGDGLGVTGNTIFVNMGAGIAQLPSDEVGIDVVSNLALQLTSSLTAGQLTFVLAAGSGLEQSSAGLKISDNGVTNAMLLNESITFNSDTGNSIRQLGETLLIAGTSTQGINTSASGGTLTITAANASASQKGVASFDATEFTVTAGNVVLGTIGNNKLANSTINFVGTDASADTVALGESLTFASAVTGLTSVAVAANVATLGIRLAGTGATTGVASFDSNHFSVTAGAVSLAATLDDLSNVAGADGATTGDLLTKGATDWEPVTRTALAGSINLGDIGNVGTATPTAGYVLSGTGTEWESKKIYHVEDVTFAATTWTVTHGLGTRYCNVTIVDATDEVVIPQSITFTSTTVVTVTFNTAIAGKAVVMGIAV